MVAKVELRYRPNPHASYEEQAKDRERAFKAMLVTFNRLVEDSGILLEYKRRASFESPGERKRRKKKESMRELRKIQNKQIGPRRKKKK